MMGVELVTPRYEPSDLAFELYGSKAIARNELSLSSWCIASLYIYHFSTVVDFSSVKYSGSTGSKAIAGNELSLFSWCVASLYIYHFSTVVDFSSEKYSGSTG